MRQGLARRTVAGLVEGIGVVGRLQVDLAGRDAEAPGLPHVAGGRIDRARRAHRHEQVGLGQRRLDRVAMHRYLAEPDHVRPHPGAGAAGGTRIAPAQIRAPRRDRPAGAAAGLEQFAVHVDDRPRAGPLVQIVDVLRAQEQPPAPPGESRLGLRQGHVRGVGLGRDHAAAAVVVEVEHRVGVGRVGLGGREPRWIEPRPDPAPVAEGAEPALGRVLPLKRQLYG